MTAQERWAYCGDVNLKYGGTFIDLSTFHDGYCNAVVVIDLDSACGFRGACLIDHVVICGTDDPERIRTAMRFCGWDAHQEALAQLLAFLEAIKDDPDNRDAFEDWLQEADRTDLLHMVADALCSCGYRDPDDGWDNYRSHHTETVQCEPDGPMESDEGWKADKRLHNTDLRAYVESVHLR